MRTGKQTYTRNACAGTHFPNRLAYRWPLRRQQSAAHRIHAFSRRQHIWNIRLYALSTGDPNQKDMRTNFQPDSIQFFFFSLYFSCAVYNMRYIWVPIDISPIMHHYYYAMRFSHAALRTRLMHFTDPVSIPAGAYRNEDEQEKNHLRQDDDAFYGALHACVLNSGSSCVTDVLVGEPRRTRASCKRKRGDEPYFIRMGVRLHICIHCECV